MEMLTFAWTLGLAAALGPAQVPAPDRAPLKVKSVKDLAYYDGPGQHKVKHRLDLFLPAEKKDFPVLVFVHGGAWSEGDKNYYGIYSGMAIGLAREGLGVAVINYRLTPEVKHPEHVRDVARAVAWIYRNIATYGGKPDRLFLCGHSAGGHLVSLVATDETYLKAVGLSLKAVTGVIPISGVFYLPEQLFPNVFGSDAEVRRGVSPLNHVRAGLPPFQILFADKDLPGCDKVPAEVFCKALKAKGVRAETLEIKDSDHLKILLAIGKAGDPVHQAILEFVRRYTVK